MSALYGAAGVNHHPALTALLLAAGADPDDRESLYHATEADDPACLRLLLEAGATVPGTNALAHALDDERLEHVRLLLARCRERGVDPNEQGALVAHAARRGRSADCLRLLVAYGLDVDRPGAEGWRREQPLRTPYRHAVARGRVDQAEALVALGASVDVTPGDLAIAAVSRGERPETPLDLADPEAQEALIRGALAGRLELTLELAGPDARGPDGGSPVGALLHHAAWAGNADLVRELLARGADPGIPADADFATPLGWAALASGDDPQPGRDHVAVAQLLVDAGDAVEERFLHVAGGPLLAWLEAREAGTPDG